MDDIDRRILIEIQKDISLSVIELASRVGLSSTPCWKRIQKLEANGVIQGRVAIVSPEAVGLGLTVLVGVELAEHTEKSLSDFVEAATKMPEVLDLWRMAGQSDYELRVVAPDMQAYDLFYKKLIALAPLRNVTSRFVMDRIKATTALPIRLLRDLQSAAA